MFPPGDVRLEGKCRTGKGRRDRDEPKSFGHPEDVRVDGKRLMPEGEQKKDVRGLNPDAGQRSKVPARLGERLVPEEVEGVFPALLLQPGKRRKDRLRFRLRQPSGPDRLLYLGGFRPGKTRNLREPSHQGGV